MTETKKVSISKKDIVCLAEMSDDDIRKGINSDPDAAPELDESFFKKATKHLKKIL